MMPGRTCDNDAIVSTTNKPTEKNDVIKQIKSKIDADCEACKNQKLSKMVLLERGSGPVIYKLKTPGGEKVSQAMRLKAVA